MPSSARPNRVEIPRSLASWPSAESKTSETMKSTNPMTFVQRSWYANRWPATSPITSDHSVTWSAEIPVGWSARAIRIPMGRKKWRSAHSSTAGPLCAKSFCGFTEHFLHGGKGAHRLVLVDHQGGIDANLGVVDHREHAAREQRVEDPACGLLVEQPAGPGDDEIHPDHKAPPPPPSPPASTRGTTLSFSIATFSRVRPTRVIISSKTSGAPTSPGGPRSISGSPGGAPTSPAVPWIGSTMIAATSRVVSSWI